MDNRPIYHKDLFAETDRVDSEEIICSQLRMVGMDNGLSTTSASDLHFCKYLGEHYPNWSSCWDLSRPVYN